KAAVKSSRERSDPEYGAGARFPGTTLERSGMSFAEECGTQRTKHISDKEKWYLTPLERKQLKENRFLRERSRDENLPAASRTEKRNLSRTPSSKPPKHGKAPPTSLKKAKADVPPGKPSAEKENVNILIKKKMDSPCRVLSRMVKPVFKLQLGAAFFSTRKKSHSKKPLGDAKSLPADPKSLQENAQPVPPTPSKSNSADKTQILKVDGILRSVSVPQEKGNANREDSVSGVNPDRASPSNPDVYPIFSAPPATSERLTGFVSRQDAGQKHFGAIVCKSCGMIYTAGSPEDEAQHIQHHERFLEALRYVGWKKERVVAEFWDGKIVLILPDDPKYAVKKAEDVREIVDNELGFKQVSLSCPAKTKIYLFVSNEKMIVGCLVAESIKQAFRVLAEPGATLSPEKDTLQHQRPWRCSTEPEPAVCGISRIWVFRPRRGKGIARRMVDVVRSTFMYGCFLSTQEIAFSDPTPDGKLFATTYCQTPSFLVYNFISNN
uniref:Establishment of sister chromatid cohesion N-acetyltransferase 2 n=1 Tax=Calidris pygmaea TaxID=425635 RepID=A0A8C3JCL9_9CHAR